MVLCCTISFFWTNAPLSSENVHTVFKKSFAKAIEKNFKRKYKSSEKNHQENRKPMEPKATEKRDGL